MPPPAFEKAGQNFNVKKLQKRRALRGVFGS
jgi:hypothetical protein